MTSFIANLNTPQTCILICIDIIHQRFSYLFAISQLFSLHYIFFYQVLASSVKKKNQVLAS